MESTGLWIAFSILTLVLAIVVGLYIFREIGYQNLIDKESKLCLSHNCAYSTPECGALPFKIGADGTPTCAPPNIFDNTFANGNVPNTAPST